MTKFTDVANQIVEIQEKKNQDYGDAFVLGCRDLGVAELIVPLYHKIRRLINLTKGDTVAQVNEEGVRDTLLDIMGYAGMGVMAFDNGDLTLPAMDSVEYHPVRKGKIILLVAPSGVGKTTLKNKLLKSNISKFDSPVSATTREQRPNEIHSKDYFFIDESEFNTAKCNGDLFEYENFRGNWYGTLRKEFSRIIDSGKDAITEIGIEGAKSIKNIYKDDCLVLGLSANPRFVVERLRDRGENDEFIKNEMEIFENFVERMPEICDVVVNYDNFQHGRFESCVRIADFLA